MTNPFPGFNPFLEAPAYWSDFHATFINYWREAIADMLPDEYEASISERVYLIEHDPDIRKLISPDVSISAEEFSLRAPAPKNVATLEPTTLPLVAHNSVARIGRRRRPKSPRRGSPRQRRGWAACRCKRNCIAGATACRCACIRSVAW